MPSAFCPELVGTWFSVWYAEGELSVRTFAIASRVQLMKFTGA